MAPSLPLQLIQRGKVKYFNRDLESSQRQFKRKSGNVRASMKYNICFIEKKKEEFVSYFFCPD